MNQGKHTAGKVVLIVLIVLVSLFDLFWMIGTIGIFMEGENASVSYNDMPVAELTDAPYLEELGQMYEGTPLPVTPTTGCTFRYFRRAIRRWSRSTTSTWTWRARITMMWSAITVTMTGRRAPLSGRARRWFPWDRPAR